MNRVFMAFLLDVLSINTRTLVLASIFVVVVSFIRYTRSPWRRLPPGPPGLPLLGNIFQLGKVQWLTFTEWRDRYGDIIYLNLAGTPVVVLNSLKTAADIMDRRSGINSDRPRYIVASEMQSKELFMGFTSYNDLWRTMRRASHEGLHKGIAKQYHPIQIKEATILASEVLADGKAWDRHLRRAGTSVVMSITYDTPTLKSDADSLVYAVNEFSAKRTKAALPGAHLVESFPWMKYIPAFLAKWKREALQAFHEDTAMLKGMIDSVRQRIAAGDERPSFAATLINDVGRNGLNEVESAWLAGSVYSAGAETTPAVMAWWMLAMVAYPDVQKRGQKEIDAVVGRDRLPNYDDFEKLPYVRAMVKEVLRWRPVAPLGSPHRASEDDIYEGYFIPKNSIIISNIWSINRDPEFGANVDDYNPARHLNKAGKLKPSPADTKEEGHVAFGFGRRICPGQYVANESLFIDMAILLWAVNIEADGPFDLVGHHDEGIVMRPKPFNCKFTPRSSNVPDLVEAALDEFGP